MLKEGNFAKSQLAQRLGISRVRLTQFLNLLKLPQKQQDYILKHGKEELITEKQLRQIVSSRIK